METGKGKEDKDERKGWKTGSHISRISKSSSPPMSSSRPPLFVSGSPSSLSLGRRRLIFGISPIRWPSALWSMWNYWRYVCALRPTKRLAPIKWSVKRHIGLLYGSNILRACQDHMAERIVRNIYVSKQWRAIDTEVFQRMTGAFGAIRNSGHVRNPKTGGGDILRYRKNSAYGQRLQFRKAP